MRTDLPAVLLVEDEEDQILLMERALKKANFRGPLRVARDGEEAVRYLAGDGPYGDRAAHPLPALVVLDLKLPRKSGLEVLAWMRSRREFRGVPAMVLSCSGERCDIDRATSLGVLSYRIKPIRFGDLTEIARSIARAWELSAGRLGA